MRPLIKWTGGKYAEFDQFASFLPLSFNRYYEPFFGGGGVFFALEPKVPAYLNDKSNDLIQFYRQLGSAEFKNELNKLASSWDVAGEIAGELKEPLMPLLHNFATGGLRADFSTGLKILETEVAGIEYKISSTLPGFIRYLQTSLADKFKRIKAITDKGRQFNNSELMDHIETAVKGAFYFFIRDKVNRSAALSPVKDIEEATANWYFVREFCYASMFRFNSKGEFNIPYGGIAYNRKNFRQKVKALFSGELRQMFSQSTFYNLDFAEFLSVTQPTTHDFIFVDPPYDSEFSAYDQNAFTRDDQVRLRDYLEQTEAMFMLVIKETEFITGLYNSPHFKVHHFDKTYTYNVRGRNNRDTRHMIILNYPV